MTSRFSGATGEALRLIRDKKLSQGEAARQAGVDPAAVSRAMAKITTTQVCPCCGQTIKEVKWD